MNERGTASLRAPAVAAGVLWQSPGVLTVGDVLLGPASVGPGAWRCGCCSCPRRPGGQRARAVLSGCHVPVCGLAVGVGARRRGRVAAGRGPQPDREARARSGVKRWARRSAWRLLLSWASCSARSVRAVPHSVSLRGLFSGIVMGLGRGRTTRSGWCSRASRWRPPFGRLWLCCRSSFSRGGSRWLLDPGALARSSSRGWCVCALDRAGYPAARARLACADALTSTRSCSATSTRRRSACVRGSLPDRRAQRRRRAVGDRGLAGRPDRLRRARRAAPRAPAGAARGRALLLASAAAGAGLALAADIIALALNGDLVKTGVICTLAGAPLLVAIARRVPVHAPVGALRDTSRAARRATRHAPSRRAGAALAAGLLLAAFVAALGVGDLPLPRRMLASGACSAGSGRSSYRSCGCRARSSRRSPASRSRSAACCCRERCATRSPARRSSA